MSLLIDVRRPGLKSDSRAVLGLRPPGGCTDGLLEPMRRAWSRA